MGAFPVFAGPARWLVLQPESEPWSELPGFLATIAIAAVVLWWVRRPLANPEAAGLPLGKGGAGGEAQRFRRQLVLILLTALAVVAVILASPLSAPQQGQLLNLLGIVASGALALSSTTFLGNILGGFMLRAVRNFKIGDFLRVEEHFGRVTERGLFHVELQTEDRDLVTLPNLYLVMRPVVVVRSSGTIVSASVSLGYDVPRERVRELLMRAAGTASLREPFVRILDLGDHSIEYRVGGLLEELNELLSTRTRLRGAMLDELHGAGIEIASPAILSTRAYPVERAFRPQRVASAVPGAGDSSSLDALAFDKADRAATLAELEAELGRLGEERAKLAKADLDAAARDAGLERLDRRIAHLQHLSEERRAELQAEDGD